MRNSSRYSKTVECGGKPFELTTMNKWDGIEQSCRNAT